MFLLELMATNFKGSYVLNQFPSIIMIGMKRFFILARGAIQGHHGPLVLGMLEINSSYEADLY